MEYVEPNIVKLSNADFQLEEPWQDVRGFDVYDNNGDKIGTVEDLYFDRETHVARFFDVSVGGFLKMGKKHLLIPVEEFTRDASEEGGKRSCKRSGERGSERDDGVVVEDGRSVGEGVCQID